MFIFLYSLPSFDRVLCLAFILTMCKMFLGLFFHGYPREQQDPVKMHLCKFGEVLN